MAVIKTKPPQFKKYNHLIKKLKKDGIMKKKLYFKVWQSQDCVGDGYGYYIDTIDHIQELSYMFKNNEIEDIPICERIS